MVYSLKGISQLQEYTDYDTYLRGTKPLESFNPVDKYIWENYGQCKLAKCSCLKLGIVGTQCDNWVPTTASTFEELAEWQKGLKND